MFLFLRQRFLAFLILVRTRRQVLFLPVFFILSMLGFFMLYGLPASTRSPNPYMDIDLPLPVLPVPYSPAELKFYEDEFADLLTKHRFNGTVLVARRGMVIYRHAFGFADFRDKTPLTEDTPFQLASISKTFTATAILLLQQDGLLEIDDPVARHIPEFPYPQMTIRHMLNHTSGIQNYMWLVEHQWKQSRPPDNEDVLKLFIRHQRPVDFAAGTRFAYSNTGYAFLALVVERVSGTSFADFLKTRIFDPLEMRNSFAFNPYDTDVLPPGRALGFRPGRRSFLLYSDVRHDGVMGDKGLYSSVNDLYKWDQAIYRHALLSPGTWDEAFTPAVLQNLRTVDYGYGWRLQTFLDGRVVHHPGRWNGFRTSFKRFIDNQATLILLSNDGRNLGPVVDGMQKILFHQEIANLSEKPSDDTNTFEEDSYGN